MTGRYGGVVRSPERRNFFTGISLFFAFYFCLIILYFWLTKDGRRDQTTTEKWEGNGAAAGQNAELKVESNAEPGAKLPHSRSAEGRDERHRPASRTCHTPQKGRPAAQGQCYKNNSFLPRIYEEWSQRKPVEADFKPNSAQKYGRRRKGSKHHEHSCQSRRHF